MIEERYEQPLGWVGILPCLAELLADILLGRRSRKERKHECHHGGCLKWGDRHLAIAPRGHRRGQS